MRRYLYIVLIFSFLFDRAGGQVFPANGSLLNYRVVGFSFPGAKNVRYKLEIASGDQETVKAFNDNIINSVLCLRNRSIVTVPQFGVSYTWRVVYMDKSGKPIRTTGLNHFATGYPPSVDTTLNRLRVIEPAVQHKDAYVFVDATGVLYDMSGHPVWYLPEHTGQGDFSQIRDLKKSAFGTITFLKGSRIYEISYDAQILWEKPGNSSVDKKLDTINNLYHHEISRLANGHYMVMGSETLLCKFPDREDSTFVIFTGNAKALAPHSYGKVPFGTIVEFDKEGKILWSWETAKYVMQSDLIYNETRNSLADLHDNSFFFDEKNKTVYVSFKGVSRVIKIKYPGGEVLNAYGIKYGNNSNLKNVLDMQENRYLLFCGQHACRRSAGGELYLFDNGCNLQAPSHIAFFEEPKSGDTLKKTWEYVCRTDDLGQEIGVQTNSGGGNVMELPDGSVFASMGYQCNKVFIINRKKEVLWSAVSEKWDAAGANWKVIPSYRSSIISAEQLKKMIWQSQK